MTEDLYKQARADFMRAKMRAEETTATAKRALAEDAEAQAELAEMQTVLNWFEQHRSQGQDESPERTAAPVTTPAEPPLRESVPEMNLSDRVEQAVTQLGGEARNPEIREHLLKGGHDYTPLQIRGSTKYLAQKGRLVSGGYGIWRLPLRETGVPFEAGVAVMNGAGRVPLV